MSHRGVSIEEIARLVGHASTRTTEIVYRRELRPVITTGAEIMDGFHRNLSTARGPSAADDPHQSAQASGVLTGTHQPGRRWPSSRSSLPIPRG